MAVEGALSRASYQREIWSSLADSSLAGAEMKSRSRMKSRGALFLVENGLEVFAPKFGGSLVFQGKKFRPLTQSATRLGAFAEFFEPVIVGFHGPGQYSPEN